jgi:hypothetical protein
VRRDVETDSERAEEGNVRLMDSALRHAGLHTYPSTHARSYEALLTRDEKLTETSTSKTHQYIYYLEVFNGK